MKRVGAAAIYALVLISAASFPQFAWPQSATQDPTISSSPASPVPLPATLTVVAGEQFVLVLETSLHTGSTKQGDPVSFRTNGEVLVGKTIVLPPDSLVHATVVKVRRPGRIKGRAEIHLHFEELVLADGTALPLSASIVRAGLAKVSTTKEGEPRLKGEGGNNGSLISVAQGGLQGAALGGVFGGAKGAAYGGAMGAGVGLAGVLLQRGPDLDLPRDMLFEVKLDKALNVPQPAAQRAAQMARSNRSATGSSSQDDSSAAEDNPEPVPDFDQQDHPTANSTDTETVASNRGPSAPPPQTPPVWEDPDPDGFKLKVDVQLVMVDAVVRDRAGHPMDNLRREDFRVYENSVEQKIQSFSRDELPLAVALVVDRSGSVAPYMNELRHAAYQALSQLKRGDQVALFTFAGEVQRLEDLTTDRRRIADRIAQIHAGGGTNIIDALFDATYYLSAVARDRRRAIILISDNAATTKPRASQSQTIQLAMESETVVYSVKTAGDSTPLTMRVPIWLGGTGSVNKVTQETGGEIIDVTRVGSLDAALATVISRLKLRYSLGYQSTNTSHDPGLRKIDVRLDDRFGRVDQDYSVHARRGYYSPTEKVATHEKQ
jgi:VWFA-related protein